MVSAVVLAAGASTRMGAPKLLLPFGGEPLVRRAVRQVSAAGFDDVLVVVGSEHEATLAALEGLPVRHAVNLQFASGMGSSFRTAVEHLPDSDAAMFALADQPFVTTNEYRTVLDTYRRACVPHRERAVRRSDGAAALVRTGVLPRARRAPARRALGPAPSHRPDHDPAVSAGSAGRCGHTRGLRAGEKPTVFRSVKAADRSAEEAAFEPAANRQDLSHDRHRHFVRRFRAQREPDRAAYARRASPNRACSRAPQGPPAASRNASGGPGRRRRRHPIPGRSAGSLDRARRGGSSPA